LSITLSPGLGAKKRDQIWFSRSASAVAAMRSIKHVFDPKGILNPYKVIPEE
jgi:D-2-hydroxyglutarate dehydrogenase